MPETRKCPYCAEEISADAIRCRYCRTRLTTLDPESWHRDHPERRIAGVAAAVSRGLGFPLSLVRLGFLILTFIHFLGPLVYVSLWLIVPFRPGGDALLTIGLEWASDVLEGFRRDRHERAGGSQTRNGRPEHSGMREDLLS